MVVWSPLVAILFGFRALEGVESGRPRRRRFVRRSRSVALVVMVVLDRGADEVEYLSAMESEPGVRMVEEVAAEAAVVLEKLRWEGGV